MPAKKNGGTVANETIGEMIYRRVSELHEKEPAETVSALIKRVADETGRSEGNTRTAYYRVKNQHGGGRKVPQTDDDIETLIRNVEAAQRALVTGMRARAREIAKVREELADFEMIREMMFQSRRR